MGLSAEPYCICQNRVPEDEREPLTCGVLIPAGLWGPHGSTRLRGMQVQVPQELQDKNQETEGGGPQSEPL